MNGKTQDERGSGKRPRCEFDAAAVCSGDGGTDRQAEPSTAGASASRWVAAREPLKEVWLSIHRNARPAVAHRHRPDTVSANGHHANLATARRVTERVIKEVVEQSLQQVRIAHQASAVHDAAFEGCALGGGGRLPAIGDLFDQVRKV